MNPTRKVILGILLIYSYTYCYSQQILRTDADEKAFHQRIIARVPYIFEGKVIKQEYFHSTDDRNGILTCSVIEIAKIYKGSPKIMLGTIKVISDQGGPGQKVFDGGEALDIGNTYIVFGTSADSTMFHSMSMSVDNPITVDRMTSDQPIRITGKNSAWWFPQKFTLDSIHSFFNENGLVIQQEIKTIKSTADSTKH